MKKSVLLVFFVAAISGCANFNLQPIDSKATASLKGQTVTHTNREMPDFAAMTPAKAAFGLFGAAAMISEGNKIIKDNNVSNPADAIALNLTKFLEEKYGARLVIPSVPISTDDLVQIASTANGKAKLVIDVQSGWSLAYFPTDWSHYRVMHTAKVRLIDTESKILVAEGFCKRIPETNENAPTYDELLANGASRLKAELSLAINECITNLRKEMLSPIN